MGFFVGIDLGATKIAAVLLDPQGNISSETRRATESTRGVDGVVAGMLQAVEDVLHTSGVARERITGVGVGAPGPVNPLTGEVSHPPNLPGWGLVPLADILRTKLELPVRLDNDANVAALAENKFGAGKGCADMLYLTISTGIGGGIISRGELVSGAFGLAGEVGHMTLDPEGPACGCGGRGCLEAFSSGTAIAWEMERLLQCGFQSAIRGQVHGNKITAEDVFAACHRGDALAEAVVNRAVGYLGLGVANLVNILNPEKVVLGGGVAKAGALIFEPVRKKVARFALGKAKNTAIVPAALGDLAGAIGAAALWLQDGSKIS